MRDKIIGTDYANYTSSFIYIADGGTVKKLMKNLALRCSVQRIKAIIVYPMNNIANSQELELEKFKEGYLSPPHSDLR